MEASGSPKDSSGREVHSDWPVWNLQKRGNWSANAPSDPSHQAALEPSNARKRASWGRVRESDGERNAFFFSQGGTRAQHSWHCHWPPNNPYSILCAAASVNGRSV